jgi:nitroreductase
MMDWNDVLRGRHMVRSFSAEPVAPEALDRVLGAGLRAPSAGFAQAVDLLVLEGPSQTLPFFRATSDPGFVEAPGPLEGLLPAPVVVIPLTDPSDYVARYAEPDKAASDLSALPAGEWPVPYWHVDAAFAVMLTLLAAVSEGLGGFFFRLHRSPEAFLASVGVPTGREAIGAVALGHEATTPGPSGSPSRRRRRPASDRLHRGRW